MEGAHDLPQTIKPYGVNCSVTSSKEAVRLTMVNQEALFRYQLNELHRIHKKQAELMEELEGTVIGPSPKQSKKPKLDLEDKMVIFNAPTTPETTAGGKQVLPEEGSARSSAEALVTMSSSRVQASADCLLWFAKAVTSVKHNADVASGRQKRRKPDQHGKPQVAKRRKGAHVEAIIGSWGTIKNGKRSRRVRASNPCSTFQRGAFLCRWT